MSWRGFHEDDASVLQAQLALFKGDAALEILTDKSLIALQGVLMSLLRLAIAQLPPGPKAHLALQQLTKFNIQSLPFMNHQLLQLDGKYDCLVTRCGYTGEDGFEISVSHSEFALYFRRIPPLNNDSVVPLTERLLQNSEVKLAGLGPRDSLRIEAGLCLYGQEIDEHISPIAAGLAWCIGAAFILMRLQQSK